MKWASLAWLGPEVCITHKQIQYTHGRPDIYSPKGRLSLKAIVRTQNMTVMEQFFLFSGLLWDCFAQRKFPRGIDEDVKGEVRNFKFFFSKWNCKQVTRKFIPISHWSVKLLVLPIGWLCRVGWDAQTNNVFMLLHMKLGYVKCILTEN